MSKQSNKLAIAGILGLGVWALINKPKTVSTVGALATGPLTSSLPLDEVVGTIKRVAKDLFDHIVRASDLTGTPKWLINAISAHEIRWKPYKTVNRGVGATGPMQLTLPTIFDTVYFARKFGLITPRLDSYLRGALGTKYTKFMSLAKNRQSDSSYKKFLLDPQFNIVMGALLLRCLMVLFSENGEVNQAKLALGYNQGIAWATKKLVGLDTLGISAAGLIPKAPTNEAKAYIKDMVGQNGYFELVRSAGM